MKKVLLFLSFLTFLLAGLAFLVQWFGPSISKQSWEWLPSHPEIKLDTVFMEEMTWVEVRDGLKNGKTSVIIPTGGTEQNGPHLTLGKHQIVVKYNAGKIAETLQNCLVAPVMPYTPEGNIERKEGHMRFPGTISVTPEHFKLILIDIAESLAAHGFKNIYFLGDSFHSQEPQEEVASELNKKFSNQKVHFLNVSKYYSKNGQAEWLKNKGKTVEDIGIHAGIRDTSEILAISPQINTRPRAMKKNGGAFVWMSGVSGDPTQASAELGQQLLELKIKAALEQITAQS